MFQHKKRDKRGVREKEIGDASVDELITEVLLLCTTVL
jgi:hypothetical protein